MVGGLRTPPETSGGHIVNPKRTDGAKTVSYQLAADVRELIPALADVLAEKEQRRRVPHGEVIERAVRMLAKKLKLREYT